MCESAQLSKSKENFCSHTMSWRVNYRIRSFMLLLMVILLCSIQLHAQESAATLFTKGYDAAARGANDEAAGYLVNAIALDSTGECGTGIKGKAQAELGFVYMQVRRFDKAEVMLDKAIKLDPKDPSAHLNKVALYDMQFRKQEAIAELTRMIKVLPDNIDAYMQRGIEYFAANFFEEASDDFKKALELNEAQHKLSAAEVDQVKYQIKQCKKKG